MRNQLMPRGPLGYAKQCSARRAEQRPSRVKFILADRTGAMRVTQQQRSEGWCQYTSASVRHGHEIRAHRRIKNIQNLPCLPTALNPSLKRISHKCCLTCVTKARFFRLSTNHRDCRDVDPTRMSSIRDFVQYGGRSAAVLKSGTWTRITAAR
jgi:hypothetical protein